MLFSISSATEALHLIDSSNTAAIIKGKAFIMRLDIIKSTDQSNLTKAEKRILLKETRSIKANLKELRGGRYFRRSLILLFVLVPFSVFQLTE
jgi:hypothetical protein